jgi:hypothetical protein
MCHPYFPQSSKSFSGLLDSDFHNLTCSSTSSTSTRELKSHHHQQSPMRVEGIHTRGCCPLPRRYRFTTLLSPPQCHAVFGTMPHALGSVVQSPVCRPGTLSPPLWGRLVWILEAFRFFLIVADPFKKVNTAITPNSFSCSSFSLVH